MISTVLQRPHNKEVSDQYSSPSIIRVIKLRRMRWAGLVACMEDNRGAYRALVERCEGRRPLGKLKWVFKKWDREVWTGLIWLTTGIDGGRLWIGQRTFGFHRRRGISWLAEDLLVSKEDSATWSQSVSQSVCFLFVSLFVCLFICLKPRVNTACFVIDVI